LDKEVHYVAYDPDEIWREMVSAYVDAGGDILYPGDEKEMLLRGSQAVIVQVFAGVDNALRMNTLRYAVGEYLDLYGEKRNCVRIPAQAATSTIEITFRASGVAKTIPTGTALTGDGERIYLTAEDIEQTGLAQTTRAEIICQDMGGIGNGLISGTQMQFMIPNPAVISVYTVRDASGGQDEEDDETYRARIRTFGLANNTTGPQSQYESAAKNVTSEILDARALNLGAGSVGIYLLLASDVGAEGIIASVAAALNAQNVRPLTDNVQVQRATKLSYVLNVQYGQEAGSNIAAAVAEAVAQYQIWQDRVIGRAFNPDKLMAMLYQAGATRVIWGTGSHFNSGAVEYTAIEADEHCDGEITMAVIA
jgi:phage-related baseplate assembly protein